MQGDEIAFEHDFVKGFERVRVTGRVHPEDAVLSLECKLLSNGRMRLLPDLSFASLK